jgi:hypothetical protein
MLKIAQASAQSQAQPTCHSKADTEITAHSAIDCNLPLPEFFAAALKENEAYCASRQGKERYTSPLFNLVRNLKSHPTLAACSAEEAFARLNSELHPNWGNLFPTVTVVSLEFVTAWEQANIPACSSALLLAGERAINQPLTLRKPHVCEGYDKYLAVALHLQRLTPRRDILLPVKPLSGLLSQILGKSISEQSMSNYCRLAQNDGYITRTVKAHHPSGKAAQYRFDLKRFSDQGIELAPSSALPESHCSQGSHGTHGIQGIHGFQGNEESSSSCVLKHAEDVGQKKTKNEYREKIEEEVSTEEQQLLKKNTPSTLLPFVKTKKKKPKRYNVVSVWQAFMCSKFEFQVKLLQDDYETLVKFGRRTDEFAPLIVTWTMTNWHTFASTAVGPDAEYPAVPNVAFFHAYEAVAFNLWRNAKSDSEEDAALTKASETSNISFEELVWIYTLGEETLFTTVAEQLKYQGLLVKNPKGWEVCGHIFKYIDAIDEKYCKDEKFMHLLLNAAGIETTPGCK